MHFCTWNKTTYPVRFTQIWTGLYVDFLTIWVPIFTMHIHVAQHWLRRQIHLPVWREPQRPVHWVRAVGYQNHLLLLEEVYIVPNWKSYKESSNDLSSFQISGIRRSTPRRSWPCQWRPLPRPGSSRFFSRTLCYPFLLLALYTPQPLPRLPFQLLPTLPRAPCENFYFNIAYLWQKYTIIPTICCHLDGTIGLGTYSPILHFF